MAESTFFTEKNASGKYIPYNINETTVGIILNSESRTTIKRYNNTKKYTTLKSNFIKNSY